MEPAHHNLNSKIFEELERAEEDHFKNCPNAEFMIRLASTVVDLILSYLAITGLQNLSRALEVFLSHAADYFISNPSIHYLGSLIATHSTDISFIFEITLKIFFVYCYYVLSTCFSGGTPGKLLLGLKVLNRETGKKLRPGEAFIRMALAALCTLASGGISYLYIAFNKDQQSLHDRLTQSCVKKIHGVK
mgnify:CR=1 FL=1